MGHAGSGRHRKAFQYDVERWGEVLVAGTLGYHISPTVSNNCLV